MVEPAIQRHFDALKCSICYRWPITTCYRACYQDHADFSCMECLDAQYNTANNENRNRCPSCRDQLIPRESRGPDVMRNLLMDSLKVWCTNRRRRDDGSWEGCAEMVLLSGMISHRERCRFKIKSCKWKRFGCPKVDWDMAEHEDDCEFLRIDCAFVKNGCSQLDMTRYERGPHMEECIFDGILAESYLGLHGVAVHSNKSRLDTPGATNRRIRVGQYDLMITVTATEYNKLEAELEPEDRRNIYDAIRYLRHQAENTRVWLSGPMPVDLRVQDPEMDEEDDGEDDGGEEEGNLSEEEIHRLLDEYSDEEQSENDADEEGESAAQSVAQPAAQLAVSNPLIDDDEVSEVSMEVEGEREGQEIAFVAIPPLPEAPRNMGIDDVKDLATYKAYLDQFGVTRAHIDAGRQEEDFQGLDRRQWVASERARGNRIKFRQANGRKCKTCYSVKTAIWPNGQPEDKARNHTHISSRRDMLAAASSHAMAGCGSCTQEVHAIRPTLRRKVILTSSSLRDALSDGKRDINGYHGLRDHVDQIAIPGATIQELCHAFLAETRESDEPVDLLIYAGNNDLLQSKITTHNGVQKVGEEMLIEVMRCLGLLAKMCLLSPQGHTLRMAQITLTPCVNMKSPGHAEAWFHLNEIFRVTNERWQDLGVPIPPNINFRRYARHKGPGGRYVCSMNSYREYMNFQKLHLTTRCKLAVALKCARALGARSSPEGFQLKQMRHRN